MSENGIRATSVMRKFDRTAKYSNIARLVKKRQEAGDNSQKGTGGNRGGTGGGRPLPPPPVSLPSIQDDCKVKMIVKQKKIANQ